MIKMVGLGEILWDMLPTGPVLGGAPTNFAYMASVLGDEGIIASRIGRDPLGEQANQQLDRLGLSNLFLQSDKQHGTGVAEVTLDSGGQPSFKIGESVAWDHLEWTQQWEELSAIADVICFGSLAQREPVSANTIDRFLKKSKSDSLRIFDVNLRQAYYGAAVLTRSLEHANIVKLSNHELSILASALDLRGDGEDALARDLRQTFDLMLVCVTRGAHGSLLVSEQECVVHPGIPVKVVDAVGAGDAFAACLAHCFMRGYALSEISERSNRFASWVATQVGATPIIDATDIHQLLHGANSARIQG